jgi:hypothetical protein
MTKQPSVRSGPTKRGRIDVDQSLQPVQEAEAEEHGEDAKQPEQEDGGAEQADEAVAARVAGLMGPKPVFIADGHHRYETACNYRDEVAAAWAAEHGGAPLPPDHPANFVLMMLVGMSDPGLVVLPTHRLFVEPAVAGAAELAARLGDCFTTRAVGQGPEAARHVWSAIDLEGNQGVLGLYTAGDKVWTLATITPAGRARMDSIAADHGPAWRSLGVSILHRLVIGELLGAFTSQECAAYLRHAGYASVLA